MSDKKITTEFEEFSELMSDPVATQSQPKAEVGQAMGSGNGVATQMGETVNKAVETTPSQPVATGGVSSSIPQQDLISLKNKVLETVSSANENVDQKTLTDLFYQSVSFYEKLWGKVSEDEFATFILGYINSKAKNVSASYKVNFLVLGTSRRQFRSGKYGIAIYGFVQSPEHENRWAFAKVYANYDTFDQSSYMSNIVAGKVYNTYFGFRDSITKAFSIDLNDSSLSKPNTMIVGTISDIATSQFTDQYVVDTPYKFDEMPLPLLLTKFLKRSYKKQIVGPKGCGLTPTDDSGWAVDGEFVCLLLKPTQEGRYLEDKDKTVISGHSYAESGEEVTVWGYGVKDWVDFDWMIDAVLVLGTISERDGAYNMNPIYVQPIPIPDISSVLDR